MKSNLIKDKGWHLLVKLFKKANEDKEITFDEGRIINATDLNINKLLEFTTDAWSDRILTENEKQKISFLLKKIQDDAVTLAEYDDIITNEEDELLEIIRDMVENFFST